MHKLLLQNHDNNNTINSPHCCLKNKMNNNKHLMTEICQLHSMHLQKEVESDQKQPSCIAPKKVVVNKDVKSNVVAKKWF